MEVLTTSQAVREFRMHPATALRLILTQRVAAHRDANGKWLQVLAGAKRADGLPEEDPCDTIMARILPELQRALNHADLMAQRQDFQLQVSP